MMGNEMMRYTNYSLKKESAFVSMGGTTRYVERALAHPNVKK